MAKIHKPVAGSRAYWPKKRAKRIYDRIKSPATKETVPLSFAAYKAGMTQVVIVNNKKGSVTEGRDVVRPVTVLDAPDLVVCGIVPYKKTSGGLESLGIVWVENTAKDLKRKTNIPQKSSGYFFPCGNIIGLFDALFHENGACGDILCAEQRNSGIRKDQYSG